MSELPLALTIATPSRAVAERRIARGVGADEVAAELVLRRLAVDEHAIGVVAGNQVALRRPDEDVVGRIVAAGRFAADHVMGRAGGHQDAVGAVAQVERAGDVGADVVHRDLIVVRAVQLDAIGQLPLITFDNWKSMFTVAW